MPLETATYITDLVASNPAGSDPLTNADDHIRLLKATIKATLPNFTSAALQSTQAQIDATTLAVDTNGIAILADAGVNFKTNTTDRFTNPVAGEIDIVCAGTVAARFMASSTIFPGTVTATNGHLGPGTTPIGAMIMWLSDTLPSGAGVWAWANGQAISRTTYATLYGIVGTTWGAGDGVTTFNLINMQEVVPVGKSTMGGAASPGLLASISSGLKAVLNGLFGSDTYTALRSDLPNANVPVTITDPGHTHGYETHSTQGGGGTSVFIQQPSGTNANTSTSFTGITAAFNLNGNVSQTKMSIAQPSRAVNFVVRIA